MSPAQNGATGPGELPPPGDPGRGSGPSGVRIGLWVIGAGVGIYMIVSGVIGALSGG